MMTKSELLDRIRAILDKELARETRNVFLQHSLTKLRETGALCWDVDTRVLKHRADVLAVFICPCSPCGRQLYDQAVLFQDTYVAFKIWNEIRFYYPDLDRELVRHAKTGAVLRVRYG